jgi:hypothetical protein
MVTDRATLFANNPNNRPLAAVSFIEEEGEDEERINDDTVSI